MLVIYSTELLIESSEKEQSADGLEPMTSSSRIEQNMPNLPKSFLGMAGSEERSNFDAGRTRSGKTFFGQKSSKTLRSKISDSQKL